MSLFVVKQARRARRSCTSSKLSPTQRLTVEDTGDGSASKSWFFLQMMKRMKNERFYLLLWKCAVLEASFPINLEYPSYSALSSLRIFFAKHPLISEFRNFLHFVSCQRVCALCSGEMCNATRSNDVNFNQSLSSAQKASPLPIVGEGMWSPFGEMTRTFAAPLRGRKRGEKLIFSQGISLFLLRVWQNKCPSFSLSLKWQTNLTTNLGDGGRCPQQ